MSLATTKRLNALQCNEYFMASAKLAAMRSPDPNTQVGACIVDRQDRIVALGFSEFPRGCSSDEFPWAREAKSPIDTKYMYVLHAEANAISNRCGGSDLHGTRIYVTLFPCNECAKLIIQSGISEVVYASNKYSNADSTVASKRMFKAAGVVCTQFETEENRIEINFTEI